MADEGKQLQQSWSVYLAPPPSHSLHGLLGVLARLYSLDSFGGTLMTRRVALGLKFGAFMLTVILTFDLAAWTLFFNAIFHSTGDILLFDWYTVLALLFGGLIACAIFIYEREFFCTDLSDGSWRRTVALFMRAVMIVAAAYITSRPVELLVFRGAVQQRTHEERMFDEAVRRLHQREENLTRVSQIQDERNKVQSRVDQSPQAQAYKDIQQQLNDASARRATAAGRLEQAKLDQRRADGMIAQGKRDAAAAASDQRKYQRDIDNLENQLNAATDPAARSSSESDLSQARANRGRATQRRRNAEALQAKGDALKASSQTAESDATAEIAAADGQVNGLTGRMTDAATAVQDVTTTLNNDIELRESKALSGDAALREYMSRVIKNGASTPINYAGFNYRLEPYDFFHQLRIIENLRTGEPAKWVGVSDQAKHRIVDEFGLPYVFQDDKAGLRRLQSEGKLFSEIYWVTFAVAVLIPSLIMLMKLVMPADLRAYYANLSQANAGNAESMLIREIQAADKKEIEEEKARRRAARRRDPDDRDPLDESELAGASA